jgi:DNA repair exonuclease SbcCD ATPase subunit
VAEPTDAPALQARVHELRAEVRDLRKYVGQALGSQSDATDQKIAAAAKRLTDVHDQTRRELATVKQKGDKLDDDLRRYDRRTDERIEALSRRLDKLDARLDSLAVLAEGTQREFELLNRKVRQAEAPGARAGIDSWAVGQQDLADQVAQGRAAAQKLQAMADHKTLRTRIDKHDQHVTDLRQHQDLAVAAARELAELDPDAVETLWAQQMRTWTRHQQAAAALTAKLAASEADAAQARAEMAVYTQRTGELVPAIEQGELAEGRLRERIRGYLETVVAADQFLPTWLEVVLGPGIPRKHWREWMDTAVGIVLYRLVHRVPSLVDALGERPVQAGERQAEYDRLTGDCELYRS